MNFEIKIMLMLSETAIAIYIKCHCELLLIDLNKAFYRNANKDKTVKGGFKKFCLLFYESYLLYIVGVICLDIDKNGMSFFQLYSCPRILIVAIYKFNELFLHTFVNLGRRSNNKRDLNGFH